MRKRILRLLLLSMAASLLSGCSPPNDDEISKRIDKIVRFRVRNRS